MSNIPTGSWQPDPYGRYAQRYFDGASWTANVVDASGNQLTDPLGVTAGATGTTAANQPPVPGLVVAAAGAVLLLLSLFVLNWFDFDSATKADLSSASDRVESVLGVSAADVNDGLKMTEIKDIQSAIGSSDLSFLSEQYLNWGYLASIAVVAFAVVALFMANLRWPAFGAAIVFAAWHAWVVYDLGSSTVDTKIGAWLGAIGLVLAGVAQLLPRQLSVAHAT